MMRRFIKIQANVVGGNVTVKVIYCGYVRQVRLSQGEYGLQGFDWTNGDILLLESTKTVFLGKYKFHEVTFVNKKVTDFVSLFLKSVKKHDLFLPGSSESRSR